MHGGKNGIIHVSAFAPIESILESGEGFLLFRHQVHRIEYLPKLCVQEVKWYKILNVANRMDVCCSETWSPERNERDRCAIDVRKSSTLGGIQDLPKPSARASCLVPFTPAIKKKLRTSQKFVRFPPGKLGHFL